MNKLQSENIKFDYKLAPQYILQTLRQHVLHDKRNIAKGKNRIIALHLCELQVTFTVIFKAYCGPDTILQPL